MLYYMALHEKSHSLRERVVDFIIGMGTIVHHSSSMLYIALLGNMVYSHLLFLTLSLRTLNSPLPPVLWIPFFVSNPRVAD